MTLLFDPRAKRVLAIASDAASRQGSRRPVQDGSGRDRLHHCEHRSEAVIAGAIATGYRVGSKPVFLLARALADAARIAAAPLSAKATTEEIVPCPDLS
jgi:hypothetical protein